MGFPVLRKPPNGFVLGLNNRWNRKFFLRLSLMQKCFSIIGDVVLQKIRPENSSYSRHYAFSLFDHFYPMVMVTHLVTEGTPKKQTFRSFISELVKN